MEPMRKCGIVNTLSSRDRSITAVDTATQQTDTSLLQLPAQAQPIPRRKKAKALRAGLHCGRMRHADRGAQGAFRRAGARARGVRCPLMPEPAQIALGQPSPAAHHGRRLRRASSEKKAVRPPSGYPYDPSGYGACFGAKWRLPGRAGAGRCRRTPEQGWG